MDTISDLDNIFDKLKLNLKEYSKIEKLINAINKDNSIKEETKVKIYKHINSIYFDWKNETKLQNKNIEKIEIIDKNKENPKKKVCKKCNKTRFKKFDFCYKHCQEENIIPKNIKRKDFSEYEKTIINKQIK